MTRRRTANAEKETQAGRDCRAKLRQVDVLTSQGAARLRMRSARIGVTEITYYRWRKEYRRAPDETKSVGLKILSRRTCTASNGPMSDLTIDKMILSRGIKGKLLSPSRRRACIDHVRQYAGVFPSAAFAGVLGQHRSTQRKRFLMGEQDEERLTADIIEVGSSVWSLRLPPGCCSCSDDLAGLSMTSVSNASGDVKG